MSGPGRRGARGGVAHGGSFEPESVIDGQQHRMTLGLRALDPTHWLLVDEEFDTMLAEKRRLLQEHSDQVLATMPQGDAPAAELLKMIVADKRRHHPGSPADPDPDEHPIRAAALLVQEDLCVLTQEPQGWVMTSACVCFPSRWDLPSKMGRTVRAIHDPVPHYSTIARPVDMIFDRLTPDRPMWRTNWTMVPSPALFMPDRPAVDDAGGLTFRVERQTLRRLPNTSAIVFTIRTYRHRLAALGAVDPKALQALAATVRTVDPQTARYRGWHELPALQDWLRAHVR